MADLDLDELVEVGKRAARLERKSDLCAICTRFGKFVNCFCGTSRSREAEQMRNMGRESVDFPWSGFTSP